MFIIRFVNDLLENKIPGGAINRIALGFLVFAALAGTITIVSSPAMTARESVYMEMIKQFASASGPQQVQVDYTMANKYMYSLPWRLSAEAGLTTKVFLLRAWGLVFFLITLSLSWLTARKLFKGNDSLSLMVLAFMATSNQLLSNAVSIGGEAFNVFLFAVFVYFLIEVAGKGSFMDIAICLVLIFVISRVDYEVTAQVLIPILSLTTIATLLFLQKRELLEYAPKANLTRAALLGTILLAGIAASRVSDVLAAMLSAPASLWPAVSGLTAWPRIVGQLAAYFSGSLLLPKGFFQLQTLGNYFFQITGALALVGLGALAANGVSERVRIVKNTPGSNEDPSAGTGFNLVMIRPEISIFEKINLPGLIAIIFLPLTVFAAANAYAGSMISDGFLYVLILPLTMLTALGLRRTFFLESFRTLTLACLTILLTFNIAGIMITILWR